MAAAVAAAGPGPRLKEAAAAALPGADDGQPGQEGGGVRQRNRVREVWICRL